MPRLYFEIVSIILRYVSFADSQPNVDGIGLSTECSSEKDNLGNYVLTQKNDQEIESSAFNLLTPKILNKAKNIKQIYNNEKGDLEIYTVLYNKNEKAYAILNIPYKANDLKNINNEIRDEVIVLSTIYIFLFFISAVMAVILLRQITSPLR